MVKTADGYKAIAIFKPATASSPRTRQAEKRDTNPLPPDTAIRIGKPFTLKFQTASATTKP
ncbi:hypothetical protein NX87_09190 [Neisseria meningitidis]|nr:hypothetical protein NX87_09190 [Neisseria meningitidis]